MRDETAELEVMPAGGCIAAYRWRRGGEVIDWLRPAPSHSTCAPGDTGCFPLVPYSNRIRNGRYSFAGREYRLAQNFAPSPHSIHGHGWKVPWQAAETGERRLTLAYRHAGADWPAPYSCTQSFSLSEGVLEVSLRITNEGESAMPAGLGLHPYFPRTPACRLTAPVDRMWATDAEVMPTDLVAPAAGADPSHGLLPGSSVLDNCFTGFAGRAVIDWPEHSARLTLEADADFSHLVVFSPAGQAFFCVEPVSHSTDAINRGNGMRVLRPGEHFSAAVRFTPDWSRAA